MHFESFQSALNKDELEGEAENEGLKLQCCPIITCCNVIT
jgi:hypothetical protein